MRRLEVDSKLSRRMLHILLRLSGSCEVSSYPEIMFGDLSWVKQIV